MKMRRNALHVRNGESDSDVAPLAEDANAAEAAVTNNQRQNIRATTTPVRNRASACSHLHVKVELLGDPLP